MMEVEEKYKLVVRRLARFGPAPRNVWSGAAQLLVRRRAVLFRRRATFGPALRNFGQAPRNFGPAPRNICRASRDRLSGSGRPRLTQRRGSERCESGIKRRNFGGRGLYSPKFMTAFLFPVC